MGQEAHIWNIDVHHTGVVRTFLIHTYKKNVDHMVCFNYICEPVMCKTSQIAGLLLR